MILCDCKPTENYSYFLCTRSMPVTGCRSLAVKRMTKKESKTTTKTAFKMLYINIKKENLSKTLNLRLYAVYFVTDYVGYITTTSL